jgi:hypothetical protein
MPSTNSKNTDVESGITKMSKQVSTLDPRDDPFAPRDGKALLWRKINMTLVSYTQPALLSFFQTLIFLLKQWLTTLVPFEYQFSEGDERNGRS